MEEYRSIDAERHKLETGIEESVSCFCYPRGSDYIIMVKVVRLEISGEILGGN